MKKSKLSFTVDDSAPEDWDNFVSKNHGFYVQSSTWPDIFVNTNIGNGKYIRAYKGKKLVIQLLMWDSLLGGTLLLDYIPDILRRLLLKFPYLRSYSFHMGPVFDEKIVLQREKVEYVLELVNFICNLAKKEHKNIGPGSLIVFSQKKHAQLLHKKLKKVANTRLVATVRTEIKESLEDMNKIIEYSRRKNIKRAERMGVTVKESGIEKIDYYWKYLNESWKQYGLSVPVKKYYQNFPKSATKLFFAYYKKKLIAGNGVLLFGNTCIEFSIFISNYEKRIKTRGGDLIKWKIIEHCLNHQIKYWDLNMLDLAESEEKTKKINFYKLEWGGDMIYGIEVFKLNYFMDKIQRIKWKVLGK